MWVLELGFGAYTGHQRVRFHRGLGHRESLILWRYGETGKDPCLLLIVGTHRIAVGVVQLTLQCGKQGPFLKASQPPRGFRAFEVM